MKASCVAANGGGCQGLASKPGSQHTVFHMLHREIIPRNLNVPLNLFSFVLLLLLIVYLIPSVPGHV
jgi:hypothetical protein